MFKFNLKERLRFSNKHSLGDTIDFIAVFYFDKALREGGSTRIPGLGAIIEPPKRLTQKTKE